MLRVLELRYVGGLIAREGHRSSLTYEKPTPSADADSSV